MSTPRPIRLLIHGASGKMGARLCALGAADARFVITARMDQDTPALRDPPSPGSIDAIMDFSSDEGARQAAALAVSHHAALLVGTTGLSANSFDAIGSAARSCAVMIAANTSRGVAVLNHLAAQAARLLGASFDIDLIETHHTQKKDAPSGTALRLVESIRSAGVDLPRHRVHSLRSGDVVGDHRLDFAGPGERLTIAHSATSRDVFALGALRTMIWLVQQKPGRYTMEQSLGLSE